MVTVLVKKVKLTVQWVRVRWETSIMQQQIQNANAAFAILRKAASKQRRVRNFCVYIHHSKHKWKRKRERQK